LTEFTRARAHALLYIAHEGHSYRRVSQRALVGSVLVAIIFTKRRTQVESQAVLMAYFGGILGNAKR
jgi:hypothetical protein